MDKWTYYQNGARHDFYGRDWAVLSAIKAANVARRAVIVIEPDGTYLVVGINGEVSECGNSFAAACDAHDALSEAA
ncbi:MAG: hypothetical protein LBR05_03020 [Azoarcus sp.]|jgi:microcompartment protein CcmL/EutN|nr:hypothetical protein [Azoarcus sp.]